MNVWFLISAFVFIATLAKPARLPRYRSVRRELNLKETFFFLIIFYLISNSVITIINVSQGDAKGPHKAMVTLDIAHKSRSKVFFKMC